MRTPILAAAIVLLASAGCRRDTEVVAPESPAAPPSATAYDDPPEPEPEPETEPEPAPAVDCSDDAITSGACDAAPKQAALVPDANVKVDSIAADGLELRQLACALDSMPLLGTLSIVGSFAKHKPAIDRCAPEGRAFTVTWSFSSGRVEDVVVEGGSTRANACVAKAIGRAVAPFEGRCGAVVLVGDPRAAAASADAVDP